MIVMRIALAALIVARLAFAETTELADKLAAAVDLAKPKQRRAAARTLARLPGVTVAQWSALAAQFGTFTPVRPGASIRWVRLQVGSRIEKTEITVYVPPGYQPERPAPLLLSLHSTGGNGRSLYVQWRRVADRLGMLVVCPSEAGPNRGYAFTERERLSTLAALRWARRNYNVDERRVHVAGFSRGGHLAWDLALRRRDRFAGLVSMSGAPCLVISRGANNLRYLENVVDLPIRALQGLKNRPPLLDTVPLVFKRLKTRNAKDARLIELDGPRFRAVDWSSFFRAERDPRPPRVVRAYARVGEGRAFWAEILAGTGRVKENFKLVASPSEAREITDSMSYLLFMQREADERTARLEVRRERTRFVAAGKHVRRFRLLLDASMYEAGTTVRVTFNGKEYRRKARPSASVLLEEFVERFDRTFLPVAEIQIP